MSDTDSKVAEEELQDSQADEDDPEEHPADVDEEEVLDEDKLDEELIGEYDEENAEKVPENPLTPEMAADCLSLLAKTGTGLAHAYVRMDIHDKELTDISILSSYIYLRYLDLSINSLRNISAVNNLSHLLSLKAERNLLTSAKLDELPYIQSINFAHNRISSLEGVCHPMLQQLNLSMNEITVINSLYHHSLGRLHTLELRGNKLTSTIGINVPTLKNLFLGNNLITTLEGLECLVNLQTLHLRDNRLDSLDGFSDNLKKLQYVNLRGNSIASKAEIEKLNCLPLLRALIMMECPVTDEDDYRIETLIALRGLERLDKDEYTEEERQEAEEIFETRKMEAAGEDKNGVFEEVNG